MPNHLTVLIKEETLSDYKNQYSDFLDNLLQVPRKVQSYDLIDCSLNSKLVVSLRCIRRRICNVCQISTGVIPVYSIVREPLIELIMWIVWIINSRKECYFHT